MFSCVKAVCKTLLSFFSPAVQLGNLFIILTAEQLVPLYSS